ncbi:hypothetical protein EV195_101340 [Tenacibaculum skagerrakense]|uniref:Multidrug transporter n=1 Tax=Tenacibaculum skagerrakense TaxID=186571 RepID=A0A4R2P250_9FLAO|nr:multidrug transporter [Tenacibaculum skagerrakense]TCP28178.1 hypothetical protein EV195_101340 [Tenacibaculum skagerrakense]
MKNNFLLGLAIAATILTSCGDDDTADIIINDNSVTNNNNGGGTTNPDTDVELTGDIASSITLDATLNYTITGPTIVKDGATLTIPAGMVIKAAATGADVYLAVEQGGRIVAEGTSSQPIVFTSASNTPNAGDWGGLILLGKAPINSVDGTTTTTATSEIASLPYGGNEPADNSGTLRYVRVEYSGGKADGQSENNGVSFYGVGNGTIVDYVQVFEGKDDGFEFFGGTVNASHIAVLNAQDDSIDWTEGYTGTITDAYVKHGASHDKGIEADGFNTDVANNGGYFSKPTVTNLTIIGLGSGTGNEAVRLRAGTQGIFNNVWIEGFEEAFDLDGADAANPTGAGVLSGDLVVNSVIFADVNVKMKNDTGETFSESDFLTEDANATGTDFATWGAGWTRQ